MNNQAVFASVITCCQTRDPLGPLLSCLTKRRFDTKHFISALYCEKCAVFRQLVHYDTLIRQTLQQFLNNE